MRKYNRFQDNNTGTMAGFLGGSGLRRLLALACVMVLVVLQCFVVAPALTGQVHAAADLDYTAIYPNDLVITQTNSSWAKNVSTKDIVIGEDEEGNPITVKGRQLSKILNNAKLKNNESVNLVTSGGGAGGVDPEEVYLVDDDGSWKWCIDGEMMLHDDEVQSIEVVRSKNPIKYSKKPKASNKSPKVGETITISYSLDIDDFFRNSDEYKDNADEYTRLKWSANKKVSLSSKETSGTSGSVSATIKKNGSIEIKVKSECEWADLSNLNKTVSVKGKATTTTTTTRYTTRPYTPYRPTTRSGGGTIKGSSGTSGTPTTATRPSNNTDETLAPSFQTITVKEVFLTATTEQDEPIYYDENGNPIMDENEQDTEDGELDDPNSGVTLPAAAGSAAVAVAACGAGAVGRVRRFRKDMSDAVLAAAGSTAAAGKDDGRQKFQRGHNAKTTGTDGEAPGTQAGPNAKNTGEETSRNPLKKFRRK